MSTQEQQSRPEANGTASMLNGADPIVAPPADVLMPVVQAIYSAPHRGRGRMLVVALDCPHCRGDHRHTTTIERPAGLVRPCPVTGRAYTVLPLQRRRVIPRG